MPNINRVFNGGLNLDDHPYRLPEGAYLDSLNVTRDSQGEGQDGVVATILGNSSVSFSLPSGTNKIIGGFADKLRNRYYFFNWNNNDNHGIYYYNQDTDIVTTLLVSKTNSAGVDILKFNPSYKIYGVNIIYRDNSEGDLIFFNDGLNPPRVINESALYPFWKEEYISVAKAPPLMVAKPVYENESTGSIVLTPIMTSSRSSSISLFQGGIQTDFGSFPIFSSSLFTANGSFTEFTYTGATANVNISVNLNLFFNFTGSVLIRVTINGVDSVTTNQTLSGGFGGYSYNRVVNLSLSANDVVAVKLTSTNPISYPTQFFNLTSGFLNIERSEAGSNPKVSVNNLRNSLFQFRYRYVYDNFEKSVWSSASVVPLPNQSSLNLTSNSELENSRISVSFSTGDANVKAIELAFRKFSNNFRSDWQLIDSFDKEDLGIDDNDVYTYKFYNDGVYTVLDVLDVTQLQDYVPQIAKAQEMLNGNTPIYGAITEGYDAFVPNASVETLLNSSGFFYDMNGLLFFATINGNDSGSDGTTMNVFLYGTGTNSTSSGQVSTLNNSKADYVINAYGSSNVYVGATYSASSDSNTVSTILGGVSSALVLAGWTQLGSITNNVLTMTFPSSVKLSSSGTKIGSASLNNDTTSFANVFEGAYQVGLMYFDEYGRTNGTITSTSLSYNTPKNDSVSPSNYCQPVISINNTPPSWAKSYQIVRSNNVTYNKRLFWISDSAYSNGTSTANGLEQFAYVGINNIDYYNEQIEATQGVVNYTFTQGDRIRFLLRYDGSLSQQAIAIKDYEVLGVETNVVINGRVIEGRFVKIAYPFLDITSNFAFDNTPNFQNYQILIYNYSQQSELSNRIFFEFGKRFGIGNAGTSSAYHIGLEQNQNGLTPAKVSITNGDLFYRKRKIPVGTNVFANAGMQTTTDVFFTIPMTVSGSPLTIGTNVFANQISQTASVAFGSYPTSASNDCVYSNTSSTLPVFVRFKGKYVGIADSSCTISLIAKLVTSSTASTSTIMFQSNIVEKDVEYEYDFDTTILVAPNTKVFILGNLVGRTSTAPTLGTNAFTINVNVINNITIPIIETSFSDVYNVVTNSNGRESVFDENAKRNYFPTMVRFGQAYQQDTSINGTNRFYAENFDTYDRGFGDIQRLHVRDRYMKVYQKLKVGNVPVLTQIVKDVAGNPLQANTDQLINKIQYYSGDYGIGDSPCSLAWDNFADYFVDDFRGVVCRLSQDGITPISILYKTNSFFVAKLKAYRDSLNNGIAPTGQVYKGNPTIYGAFDAFTNKYIVCLEEINRYSDPNTLSFHQDPYTLSFDEVFNQWESFYSYHPEWIGVLNTLLLSFKNGGLWKHNSTTYCNFYGTQYDAMIEAAFNSGGNLKKTWISLTEFANTVWDCPEISSQLNTYGTTEQSSLIPASNFKTLESNYHSNFLRDTNSAGGLANGNSLKGNYLIIKFRKQNANQFFYINLVSVNFIDSPLNKQ
jgi:hypothetical protein